MKTTVFLIFTLLVGAANAGVVYRWEAPDGTVHYSDQPRAGATRITMPEWAPPEPQAVRRALPTSSRRADQPAEDAYRRLAILLPSPEQNVRDNQGNVDVTVTLEPGLEATRGHRIQLLLDGAAAAEPATGLRQRLTGVERGEHTVAAQVIDSNDQVLIASKPVVFYLKQASPLSYPRGEQVVPPGEPSPRPIPPNYETTRPDQAEQWFHRPEDRPPPPDVPPPPDPAEQLPYKPYERPEPIKPTTPAPLPPTDGSSTP